MKAEREKRVSEIDNLAQPARIFVACLLSNYNETGTASGSGNTGQTNT